MAQLARVVAADVPHNVTQRGNARRFILANDTDRSVYLTLLRENENSTVCRLSDSAACPIMSDGQRGPRCGRQLMKISCS